MSANTFALTIRYILSLTLLMPFIALISKPDKFGLPHKTLYRYITLSAIVILIYAISFIGIRFTFGPVNSVVTLFAVISYLILIDLVFKVKPPYVGTLLGLVISVLSVFLILGNLLLDSTDGKTEKFAFNSNIFCEYHDDGGIAGLTQETFSVSLYRAIGFGLEYKLFYEDFLYTLKLPFNNEKGACKYALSKLKS